MKKPVTCYVVNNSGTDHADQFDGERFVFPAVKEGEAPVATEIPIEAATLFFGVGEENKMRCVQRLGWAATNNDMTVAIERLGKFAFHLEPPTGHTAAPVVDEDAAIGSQGSEAATGQVSEEPEVRVPAKPAQNLLQKLAHAGSLRAG